MKLSRFNEKKSLRAPVRILTVAIAAILMLSLIGQCGKKGEGTDQEGAAVLVIFASSGATLQRGPEKRELRSGAILKENDTVMTKNGSVDMQSRNGSVLRVRKFSTVRIASLIEGKSRFALENGSVLARVKRQSAHDEFRISTPTSIASVRGTTFSVEVTEGKNPQVRVYAGKVAMRPRVPALEKYSAEEVKKDPVLLRLSNTLKKKEVILEEHTVGALESKTENKVVEIQKQLQPVAKTPKPGEGTGKTTKPADGAKVGEIVQSLEKEKAVTKQKKELTPQEDAEKETLVSLDNELVKKAEKSPRTEKEQISSLVNKAYEKQMDSAMNNIEKKVKKRQLKTDRDIQDYYKILEVVTLNDGGKKSGAVVAQAGNILILHTSKGVFRLKKGDVNYIDYLQK